MLLYLLRPYLFLSAYFDFIVAIAAIYRLAAAGLEGYLSILAALSAGCRE
jgi:hypothetical protein